MAQANVDIQSIDALDASLNQACLSLASLRGEVRAFMENAIMQARQIVTRLRNLEAEAQRRYDAASAAYSACLDRQHYDSEEKEYRPSCSCEERDVNNAADELYKAQSKRVQAEHCLSDMELERDQYMSPCNGDSIMAQVIEDRIPDAVRRLHLFREHVRNHGEMQAGLSSTSLGASSNDEGAATANMFKEAASRLENSTISKFRDGMRRIKEKQEEEQRRAIFRWWASGGDPNEHTR